MTVTVLDNMEAITYASNGVVSSDQYTKVLLHFNGSTVVENSAENTGITITGAGDVCLDTSKYKFGVSSCKFDGSGDYLTIPYNSQLDFGTGDFSISMWFWWNSAGYQFLLGTGTTGGMMLALNYNNQANQIGLGRHNVLWDTIFYADTIPTSQWNYITVERKSGTAYCFLNNKLIGAAVNTVTYICMGTPLYIGQHAGGYYFNGWLDEVRISKGTSYIDVNNFTTEAAEYSTDADTLMLLHMDGADASTVFEDSSGRLKEIRPFGNAQLSTTQYKFNSSSLYLDGSGDYLLLGDSPDYDFETQDFTIDFWVYPTGTGTYCTILEARASADYQNYICGLWKSGSNYRLDFVVSSGRLTTSSTIPPNQWAHIAFVRTSGVLKCSINGTFDATTYTYSGVLNRARNALYLGYNVDGNYGDYYLDEFRLSKGIARWTSNFTPETSPYSTDTYTKLLLHFDGSTIVDDSGTCEAATYHGTVQIDTDQYKFNSASTKYDGNAGGLSYSHLAAFDFASNDFTIDFWIRANAVGQGNNTNLFSIFDNQTQSSQFVLGIGAGTYNITIWMGTTGSSWNVLSGVSLATLTQNVWSHIMVCRNNGTLYCYKDGVLSGARYIGAVSLYVPPATRSVWVGSGNYSGCYFNGWLDEFRVSSIARKPISLTAPVSEYEMPISTYLKAYSEPTIKTEGIYSLKGVATQTTSLSKSLIKTFSTPLNLSGHSYIVGRIRANRTGQNIGLSFGNHVYENNGRTYVTLTGSMSFTASATADVHVEVLGAGGAGGTPGGWTFGSPGGAGGKAEGDFTVQSGTTYHIVVGGKGVINSTTSVAGGGGIASINGADNRYGGGGGGYSGIFATAIAQANALIIAGGGAGGGSSRAGIGNTGGSGGGTIGDDGISAYDSKTGYRGRGGSQTAAGIDASSDSANLAGNQAALYGGNPRTNCYGGAGGGGYWGGSAGGYSESNTMGGGGGGSGYLHPTLITNGILTTGAGSAGGTSSTNGTGGTVVLSYDTGALSDIVIPYVTPNIITADTWQLIQYDISSIADSVKGAISNIFITVVNADADNTFYLDNLFAVTASDYNLQIAKANTYAVLTEPEALQIAKANTYAVLTEIEALHIAKANTYAVLQDTTAQTKDSVLSKVVAYSVLAPLSGSNISKAVVYSVLAPLSGSNISKVVMYSVLAPLSGSNISKVVMYSVLAPPQLTTKPFIFIF